MKDYLCEDTIAAISTPIGKGAIGIVRISGKRALEILKDLFRTKSGKKKEKFEDKKMTYGTVVDESGKPIDEVLAVYMKAPKTFTGEDVVEIHSHGGMVVVREILKEVLKRGARLAEPGEFTLRAFIHGKIDLLQAEAINDLINAKSKWGAEVALKQLEGKLSRKIKEIRDKLLEVKALVEVGVDFPEEEVEILESYQIKERLEKIKKELEKLLKSYENGKILKEGIKVAIVGRPNVGKSSLLNALLKEERAIVTEIPGTTRDVIEESALLYGLPLRLIDTAGIREAKDLVERIGIERSLKSIENADVILFVIDRTEGFTEEDRKIAQKLKEKKNVILVINKKDLGNLKVNCKKIKEFPLCVEISAKKEEGLKELAEAIKKLVIFEPKEEIGEEGILNSERQKQLIERALISLEKVVKSIEEGYESPEFLSIDLDEALRSLGELTGEVTTEEMLDIIFSKFCIGK